MELQGLAPIQVFCRLVYGTAPTILDRKGDTMQVLHDSLGLENFTMGQTSVEVSGQDERNKFRIGINQIFANLTDFDDLEDARTQTREYFELALEHLQPDAIDRITVASFDIAPTESFEALRNRLNEALYSDYAGIAQAIGYNISDSAWVHEFAQGDVSGRIQFGAMRSDELPMRLEVPEVQDAPPNMLGVLAEVNFAVGGLVRNKAVSRWEQALDKQRELVTHAGQWIRERVA
ncbi:MAG TPA: hypothetical protein VGI73_00765 [Solirubrobacterales bacterium]